jgi:hypothetical protein
MNPRPDPLPFWAPSEWLHAFDKHKKESKAKGTPIGDLRNRSGKLLLQAWHGVTFAYAYAWACGFHSLTVRPELEEDSDCDITFRVETPGGVLVERPVQLKEFPPHFISPQASLDAILESVAIKYQRCPELIVAVHLNRRKYFANLKTPPLAVGQFWLWGWSQPNKELFISGGCAGGPSKREMVPYLLGRRLGFGPATDRSLPKELLGVGN